jgi:hypothetical protein
MGRVIRPLERDRTFGTEFKASMKKGTLRNSAFSCLFTKYVDEMNLSGFGYLCQQPAYLLLGAIYTCTNPCTILLTIPSTIYRQAR